MEKFNELLGKLQELRITQEHGDWKENIPNDIWEQYLEKNFKEVAYNQNIDNRRWYETSITVVRIFDGLLGIRYITNMFSESQNWIDCYYIIAFYKMKEVQTITYEVVRT